MNVLTTLSEQPEDPELGEVVTIMRAVVARGHSLSQAFGMFPGIFTPVAIALVKSGESIGSLPESLLLLSDWSEQDLKTVRMLKGAFSYPLTVLTVATILFGVLFSTVIPNFMEMFEQRNVPLPLLTQILALVSKLCLNPVALGSGVAVIFVGYRALREFYATVKGRLMIWRALLKTPVLGISLKVVTSARYCAVAGKLLRAGLSLLASLRLAAESCGNPLVQEDYPALLEAIRGGASVADHMEKCPNIYSRIATGLIRVGEEVSSLDKVYLKLAELFEEDIQYRLGVLSALIEPILLFCISGVVAVVLLAVVLPIFGMVQQFG